MHFALGKAYESNKQFDKSFEHYAEGNWLQRKRMKATTLRTIKSLSMS